MLWFLSQFRRGHKSDVTAPIVEAAVDLLLYLASLRLRASPNISGSFPDNALSMSLEYFPIPSGSDFATHRP